MSPQQDQKLQSFIADLKNLFISYFKDETDQDVLTSGCSVLVGMAIGYLSCYLGDEAAKEKVIEIIESLNDVEAEQVLLDSQLLRNMN